MVQKQRHVKGHNRVMNEGSRLASHCHLQAQSADQEGEFDYGTDSKQ